VNDERHDRVGEVGGERGFGRDRILRRNDRRVAVSWSSQVPIPVHTDLAHLAGATFFGAAPAMPGVVRTSATATANPTSRARRDLGW